jgi:UPF0755 protein
LKKSNNAVLIRLLTVILVVGLVAGGSYFWWVDAIAPADRTDAEPVSFSVSSGEGVKAIANRLAEQKLVRSSTGFFLMVKYLGVEKNLQAGEYRLNRAMDAREVARALTHGTKDVWVTIPEGWRVEEIATAVAKELDIPEKEFLAVSREGYMFPDTYRFPTDATAGAVAQELKGNFDKKVPPAVREKAKSVGLTFDQVMVLASLVEREGKTDADRPVIAGILLNRLNKDWPLQVDATLQYAAGYQPKEKTWWKPDLTETDKELNSPYNSYKETGLPPTPIANPGLSAIMAVLNPKKTEYMYYLHDPSGQVHFAKTLTEHEANIAKYLK